MRFVKAFYDSRIRRLGVIMLCSTTGTYVFEPDDHRTYDYGELEEISRELRRLNDAASSKS